MHGSTTLRVTQTTLAGRHYQGTSNKLRKATCDLRRALFTSTNTSTNVPHGRAGTPPAARANRAACASVSIPATAQPDGAGATQRGGQACGCARHARCARRAGVLPACCTCGGMGLMAGGRLGAGCAPVTRSPSKMILVSPSSGCEGAAVAATTCSCDASRLWGCGCWQERADHQSAAALAATGLVVE